MLGSQVQTTTYRKGENKMSREVSLSYTFNVPSVLTFDWLFEFQCAIVIDDTQPIVVKISDTTIGSTTVTVPYSETFWKIKLAIWHICQKLALAYALETNTEDKELSLFDNRAHNQHVG